ncbi:MAG: hypothetical protein ACOX5R_11450 [bacterium]|jgi:hypothetical protein
MKGVSDSTKPNADVRYWDNIPEQYHVFALSTDEPFGLDVEWYQSNQERLRTKHIETLMPKEKGVELVLVTQDTLAIE